MRLESSPGAPRRPESNPEAPRTPESSPGCSSCNPTVSSVQLFNLRTFPIPKKYEGKHLNSPRRPESSPGALRMPESTPGAPKSAQEAP